jgi:hypothetical protein
MLNRVNESFLSDVYQPWDQLLVPASELRAAKLKKYFSVFLDSVPERTSWWERVADEAGLPFHRDSVEFAVVGWRWIRDGYSAEVQQGGSGGTWICLAWDWGVHTSEMLRKRHDLVWTMPKPSMLFAGHPYLTGMPNVHKDFGPNVMYAAMTGFQIPDLVPPEPIASFEMASKYCDAIPVDYWHLCQLGLPDKRMSYQFGLPPEPKSLCKDDLVRHPNRETWGQWFRTGKLVE